MLFNPIMIFKGTSLVCACVFIGFNGSYLNNYE